MRTKGGETPDAEHPWNEIVPGLWMGGHHYTGPSGERTPAIVSDEFDVVISMYRKDGHGPSDHVEHYYEHLPDRPMTAGQLGIVSRLADVAVTAVRQKRQVLVRCHFGYNRSGLVVAQSLVRMGYTPDDAVSLVRYRRSEWALNNKVFVDYLTAGLDAARLLTGLDTLSEDGGLTE